MKILKKNNGRLQFFFENKVDRFTLQMKDYEHKINILKFETAKFNVFLDLVHNVDNFFS